MKNPQLTSCSTPKGLTPKISNKTGISTLIMSTQCCIKVVARAISEEKEIRPTQIGKQEVKLFLFTNDVTFYIENPKESSNT